MKIVRKDLLKGRVSLTVHRLNGCQNNGVKDCVKSNWLASEIIFNQYTHYNNTVLFKHLLIHLSLLKNSNKQAIFKLQAGELSLVLLQTPFVSGYI